MSVTLEQNHAQIRPDPLWAQVLQAADQGRAIRSHSAAVKPGDIFVALPGTREHGQHYIQEAVKRRAGYVVSCSKQYSLKADSTVSVYHPYPALALGDLAAARFKTKQHNFSLIGITGTNGKTTICYLLEYLLSQAGYRVGVLGTVNHRWPGETQEAVLTTPGCLEIHELLARMQRQRVDVVCMEVSSHALDQNRVAGLDFDLALFNNLSQDHLDYHPSMQDYYQAKAKLFTFKAFGRPRAVLNMDDVYGRDLAEKCPGALGYGFNRAQSTDDNFVRGWLQYLGLQGLRLEIRYRHHHWHLQSRLPGRHNAYNLLAAQAGGLALGLRPECFLPLQEFEHIPGRLQRVSNNAGLNIFIDYAHTPDALANVLIALQEMGFARVVVVFGCGGDRDKQKRPLMGQAVAGHADLAVLTSDNPRHEDPQQIMDQVLPGLKKCAEVLQEPDRRQAIAQALERVTAKDALLIAGKGHETYQQIGDRKLAFSDKQIVQELLADNI